MTVQGPGLGIRRRVATAPTRPNRVLSREPTYTGITRARRELLAARALVPAPGYAAGDVEIKRSCSGFR